MPTTAILIVAFLTSQGVLVGAPLAEFPIPMSADHCEAIRKQTGDRLLAEKQRLHPEVAQALTVCQGATPYGGGH
jgi:hypothetical protein